MSIDAEVLDTVAMRNVPYISYFDNEERLQKAEQRLGEIREWIKTQDHSVAKAYKHWIGVAEYSIGETRKLIAKNKKVAEQEAQVPRPPKCL